MEVEVIKLLGIVIVVVGFALKWDSILTIMVLDRKSVGRERV